MKDLYTCRQSEEATKTKLKADATSVDHLCRHEPKNPYCPICQCSDMQRKPAFRSGKPRPEGFGWLTADHIIGKKDEPAIETEKFAVCILDIGTKFGDCCPECEKTAESAASLGSMVESSLDKRLQGRLECLANCELFK